MLLAHNFQFVGLGSLLGEEGTAIYQIVKDTIEENRGEFTHLEEAVKEQMSDKPKKKKRKKGSPKASPKSSPSAAASSGANDVLGGLPSNINLDTDSDDD